MKKVVLVGLALAIGAAAGIPMALAVSGSGAGRLQTQGYLDRGTAISTTSKTFSTITDLTGSLCAKNEVFATVSGNAQGAAFALRILMDGGPIMEVGPVYVYPGTSATLFTAAFVITAGTFEGSDLHGFEVQWRSLSGSTSTIQRVMVNYQFENGTSCGP